MTPLYQHKNISEVEKSAFVRAKAEALDPQIRLSASRRVPAEGRPSSKKQHHRPPWSQLQYQTALQDAIGQPFYGCLGSRPREKQETGQLHLDEYNGLLQPQGRLSASIGFVLDYPSTIGHQTSDHKERIPGSHQLPWALSGPVSIKPTL
jgi:hypothetical protein